MAHILENGEILEVIPVCAYLGQYTLNVFNVRLSNKVGNTVTDDDAADYFEASLAPFYKAILPAAASFAGLKVQVIKPDRYDPQQDNDNAGAGTATGDPLPAQVAGVISLKTGIAERYAQGRVYLPASGEADNTANAVPSAGWITAASSIANQMIAGGAIAVGGGSIDWTWVVYSRTFNVTNPVTGFSVRTKWGTRRSRSQIGKPDSSPLA